MPLLLIERANRFVLNRAFTVGDYSVFGLHIFRIHQNAVGSYPFRPLHPLPTGSTKGNCWLMVPWSVVLFPAPTGSQVPAMESLHFDHSVLSESTVFLKHPSEGLSILFFAKARNG